jgi:large subunit ribosomal protein L21
MPQAIVELNGKQYPIEAGRYVTVDRLALAEQATLTIDKVLVATEGDKHWIGAPLVAGASATATVLNHFKDKKVIVYKMRPKKGYRRKNGHRQPYTRLQIESITLP